MRWIVLALAVAVPALSLAEETTEEQRAEIRRLALESQAEQRSACIGRSPAQVNPKASNAERLCFQKWQAEQCTLRGDFAYWEYIYLNAPEYTREIFEEQLAEIKYLRDWAESDYRTCVDHARSGG